MGEPVVLRLTDIVKSYPGVMALNGVSLAVARGEVHAIIGQNGAGKSTLINIAAGAEGPDSGTVEIAGSLLERESPQAAFALGLAVLYQQPALVPDLTVKENLSLRTMGRSARSRSRVSAARQLASVGAEFDIETRVSDLSLSQRQRLALAAALATHPDVLVLDEPTEGLSHAARESLLRVIDLLKQGGTGIVYISHRLPEVKRIADRVTVLRDGQSLGNFEVAITSEGQLLQLMLGEPAQALRSPPKRESTLVRTPRLEVRQLRSAALADLSFTIASNEIVGLAGLDGNGARECLRALAGLEVAEGDVLVDGKPVDRVERRRRTGGIVYLPGDRRVEGLFASLSVRENLAALALDSLARFGVVSATREELLVTTAIKRFGIKAASAGQAVSSLSGGNQQKVLFARTILRAPAVLLADEPTQGVDAGSRIELRRILREVAASGAAVAVWSADANELAPLCDRVLVFSRGSIICELRGDEASEERVAEAALGGEALPASEAKPRTRGATTRLHRFCRGDYFPSLVIALLILSLALYVNGRDPHFLGTRNITSGLFLASALGFASLAQLLVVITGGIDLAVGPLAGVVVTVLSFFAGASGSGFELTAGIVLVLAISVAVGLLHAGLIRRIGLSPAVTTLITYTGLQGLALTLRPTPDGYIGPQFSRVLEKSTGPVPVAFVALAAVVLGAEVILRLTRVGIGWRAIGSDRIAAHRLGTRVGLLVISAYVSAAVCACLAGILLTAEVGVGDPTVGITYTLQSITVVVLGGASIVGGRGSFISTALAAVLLQELTSATQFLGMSIAWQYWFPGLIILLAAAIYSGARGSSVRRRHPVAIALSKAVHFRTS